ncbi:MAG: GFA family protein [Candidatus Binataceae bacterium]
MITGGCLCGAVRYEAQGEPLFAVHCFCRDCQRTSGTGHVPVMGVSKALFKVTGETRSYALPGGSGLKAIRHFCPICGSLLFGTPELSADAVTIYVGSLDDLSAFRPECSMFTRSRPAWDKLADPLPEFDTAPSSKPASA